jgi:hypothetical protein
MNTMFASGLANEFYGPFYDTLVVPVNTLLTPTISLFSKKQSSDKGIHLTNMKDDAKFPAGASIDVDSISVQFINTHGGDIEALIRNYCLQIRFGGKLFFESPIDRTPGGAGINGFAAVATTVAALTLAERYYNNGAPGDRGYKLPTSHVLKFGPGPTLEVNLICGATTPPTTLTAAANGTGIFMRIYLDGLRRELV